MRGGNAGTGLARQPAINTGGASRSTSVSRHSLDETDRDSTFQVIRPRSQNPAAGRAHAGSEPAATSAWRAGMQRLQNDHQLTELSRFNDQQQETIREMTETIETQRNEILRLQEEVQVRAAGEALRRDEQLMSLEQQIERRTAEAREAVAELERLRVEKQSILRDFERAQAERAALNDQLSTITTAYQETCSRARQLEVELQTLTETHAVSCVEHDGRGALVRELLAVLRDREAAVTGVAAVAAAVRGATDEEPDQQHRERHSKGLRRPGRERPLFRNRDTFQDVVSL